MSPLTKSKLVNLYKKENDSKVKERLLLVIKVQEDKQIPFRVVKEMHRSNPWASDWLKRYDKEGIDGLKDRTKSGRPSRNIRRDQLSNKERITRKQTWLDHKASRRVNRKEKWDKVSLYSYIPHTSKMGIQTKSSKKDAC